VKTIVKRTKNWIGHAARGGGEDCLEKLLRKNGGKRLRVGPRIGMIKELMKG